VAPEVTMMGAELTKGWQALYWIRKGVELFGMSGFEHACDEFWREDQLIFQMEAASAQLQPDLPFLAQQVNDRSAEQPGGSSAYQTAPEVLAEIGEELDRMSTPEADEHPLNGMSRIRAVIDSLHRISTSRNRYLENDLDVIFSDRFLVHAMARDPHAA
jgi:hypothetical protein